MAFMRKSKFRHIFGKPLKKEDCYDALRLSRSSWDTKFCAVNTKFLAVISEAGAGSSFVVLPLSKVGRLEIDYPPVCGHRGSVFDIAWNPFDDNMIASCSDDTTVKIWQIPDKGLTEPMAEPLLSLEGAHQRRVTNVAWHPTASHILLTAGLDCIVLWNLDTGEVIDSIEVPDQIYSISFNEDGSQFASTCKDKKLRVYNTNPMTVEKEVIVHQGAKPPQCAFMKNGLIFTTGFSRMSERQYALWDTKGDEVKNMNMENIDSSNGVMHIMYDPDLNLVYLVGKGDSLIRYYEITEEAPYVHYLSLYQSSNPQKGGGFMPKRGMNVNQNEITRFYKLHNNGMCEVIPFFVPRKSELFQDDLYPDTASEHPALTAEEFLSGKRAKPLLFSFKEEQGSKKEKTGLIRKPTSLADKKKPEIAQKLSRTNNGGAEEPAPADTASVLPPEQENSQEMDDLKKEVEELRKLVNGQEKRIVTLEGRLTQLERSNHTDEEDDGEVA